MTWLRVGKMWGWQRHSRRTSKKIWYSCLQIKLVVLQSFSTGRRGKRLLYRNWQDICWTTNNQGRYEDNNTWNTWNKQDDQLEVNFLQHQTEATKRGVLKYLASVYHQVGLILPTLVCGMMIFGEICNLNISKNTGLLDQLKSKWERWKKILLHQLVYQNWYQNSNLDTKSWPTHLERCQQKWSLFGCLFLGISV